MFPYRKKINANHVLIGIGTVLLILLIISILIRHRENQQSPDDRSRENLILYALSYLEEESRGEIGYDLDCSSFTGVVYKKFGIDLPQSAYDQYTKYGVGRSESLEKGDLVFFSISGNAVSHVGIYMGNDRFIHSPGTGRFVRIDTMTNSYFKKCFISGGKIKFEAR